MDSWVYSGRWALVTGASAGIGEAFARALAARGVNLVLSARREDRLRALSAECIERWGVQTAVVPTDLALREAAAELWKRAGSGREIHLLVNNAGFGAQGRLDEIPLERQVEMVQLNCVSLLELAHLAVAEMRSRASGGIINVASVAAFQPVPKIATYAATKAFVLSLSEAMWIENREAGVRILALCPGRTPTEFQAIAGTGSAEGAFGSRTADEVVEAALSALEAGRSVVVPGLENQLAAYAVRAIPRSITNRVLKPLIGWAMRKG